jgi:DNA-binding transcriptional LysR family regulator
MNIQNLKYFIDSARFKSMTKAADLNHLSRPAVSQAIQKLEQELGVKLLVHKRRSFELTQAGLTLLKRSEALFAHIEDTKAAVKDEAGPLIGEYRIGSARTLANFALHASVAKMRSKFPQVDFKIELLNSQSLIEKLENRELDAAFFVGDETLSGFKQIVVGRGSFCLVKPKRMKTEDVAFAITERRPETERLKVLFERHFNSPLPVFAEIPSWDAIWAWANKGVCGGLVPDFLIEHSNSKELSIVFEKVFPYEIKAMFPRNKSTHPIVSTFIQSLKLVTP